MSTIPGYLQTSEIAKRYGLSSAQITRYITSKRIKGAVKIGRSWMVPEKNLTHFEPEKPGPKPGKSKK